MNVLTLKALSKIAADDILQKAWSLFVRQNIIRLIISCESSAEQTIHMKCQIFSLKNRNKTNENVEGNFLYMT